MKRLALRPEWLFLDVRIMGDFCFLFLLLFVLFFTSERARREGSKLPRRFRPGVDFQSGSESPKTGFCPGRKGGWPSFIPAPWLSQREVPEVPTAEIIWENSTHNGTLCSASDFPGSQLPLLSSEARGFLDWNRVGTLIV